MAYTLAGKLCGLHTTAYVLMWIGAINWGLVALGGYIGMNLNVVNLILGGVPYAESAVYLIV